MDHQAWAYPEWPVCVWCGHPVVEDDAYCSQTCYDDHTYYDDVWYH